MESLLVFFWGPGSHVNHRPLFVVFNKRTIDYFFLRPYVIKYFTIALEMDKHGAIVAFRRQTPTVIIKHSQSTIWVGRTKQTLAILPFRNANSLNNTTTFRVNVRCNRIFTLWRFTFQVHIVQRSYSSKVTFHYLVYGAIVEMITPHIGGI